MSRASLIVIIGRILQRIPLSPLRLLEAPFISSLGGGGKEPYVIILLALPRSGSTLMYQTLCHRIKSTYLSNLSNLLYQLPLIGGWVSSAQCGPHKSSFSSKHGFVSGLCGPAEGLRYWKYWFNMSLDEKENIVNDSSFIKKRRFYLRNTFKVLSRNNNPIITGYLGHALDWRRLRDIFPKAIFVRLHRDPIDNALSLLKSSGSKSSWFSVCPVECSDLLNETMHERVARQVYWLNKKMSDLEEDPLTIHVSYEELCTSPSIVMEKIIQFCKSNNYYLECNYELPSSFNVVNKESYEKDRKLIASALDGLVKKYGEF